MYKTTAIRPGIISDKLNNAIATGNWGRGRVGVTQLLDRTNYLSTISHLRRVQSPLSRTQPNFEARDLLILPYYHYFLLHKEKKLLYLNPHPVILHPQQRCLSTLVYPVPSSAFLVP